MIMAKKRKIGFIQDTDNAPEVETSPKQDVLKEIIEKLYSPTGDPEMKVFYSTLEIQYNLSEWIYASLREINLKLTELGYKTANIDGSSCWVVYEKCEEEINL